MRWGGWQRIWKATKISRIVDSWLFRLTQKIEHQ